MTLKNQFGMFLGFLFSCFLIIIILRVFVRTDLFLLVHSPTVFCTRCSKCIKTLEKGKQFFFSSDKFNMLDLQILSFYPDGGKKSTLNM